jgi:hypothetical protein
MDSINFNGVGEIAINLDDIEEIFSYFCLGITHLSMGT